MKLPGASRQVAVSVESDRQLRWGIAEEVPIEIGFEGVAWTVMMATPLDVEDLAVGLAVTEGIITNAGVISHVDVRSFPEGITADIRTTSGRFDRATLRRRTLDGVTGCGLCGVETLAEVVRTPALRRQSSGVLDTTIDRRAIAEAFAALPEHQSLNRDTHTVHGAAWCTLDGAIRLVREDVGRHNALDKVVGALHRAGHADEAGFLIMSSRCSFELVYKAAAINALALATISAPTGRALDMAAAIGLPLACRTPDGDIAVFEPEKRNA